ncbi:MAG: hypothetical protein EPN23_10790 [Verrucomicrobia bacterium]|nr:MAG: hypothetical protein EPN23_10790 [Verrucomicrobiota bacterium]
MPFLPATWLKTGGLVLILTGLVGQSALASETPSPSVRISPLHFRPQQGGAGDTIAFYWQGGYHVFYLNNAGQWAHNVSTDLIHWKELPPALSPSTGPAGPDAVCWTGSVVEHAGTFYLFYTGQNLKDPRNDQKVMLATSKDLIHWEKQPDRTFYPDGKIYWSKSINGSAGSLGYHHQAFRDPDVFWNEQAQQWWMLLHALKVEGHIPCVGLYTSPDLMKWTPHSPLVTGVSADCSQTFPLQGRWFIIGVATDYMSAPTPAGPYPQDLQLYKNGGRLSGEPYDCGDLFVPKSLFDGKRRFLCGTLPRRDSPRDDGTNGWSGRLLIYEMSRRADGTLGVRIPQEVEESFGTSTPVRLPEHPCWPRTASGLRVASGQAHANLGRLPTRCLLSAQLVVPPTGRAGFWLGGNAKGEQAFRLFVDVGTQRVIWDRDTLPLGAGPAKERPYRPLKIQPGDKISVKIALDGDAAVACINDTVGLATRIYDRRDNTFGMWSDTVGTEFSDITLRSVHEPTTSK